MSESHLGRWQRRTENNTRVYVRRSLQLLQKRFEKPALMRSEITLMTILVLLTHEVCTRPWLTLGKLLYHSAQLNHHKLCEGNDIWKQHYAGVIAWVQCRQELGEIDPFLTTLLSMIGSQCVLHMRGHFRQQSYRLLEALSPLWVNHDAVDVVFGCSVDLPQLIVSTASALQSHKFCGDILTDTKVHSRLRRGTSRMT